MTFRARTGTGRPRTWDDRDRRSFLLNVGFGLTVLAAVLLLLIAFGVSWYGDHLAAAATVNGQTITRDAYSKHLAVNEFRIDYQTRRVRTLLTAGRIRPADAEARLATLAQYREQNATIALEQLIDGRIMDQLAADQGLTASEADVDARIVEEATTPELRHAWMIAVEPELADGETEPSAEAVAAARTKAGQALADLRAGKDWDTIAKTVSTDASRDQAGDLGYIDENASLDAPFLAALQGAAADTPTDVVEGDDGIFRVGRVTEVVAPVVDATLEQQAVDDGVDREAFRAAMRTDAIRTKLSDAVLAPMLAAGPQREAQEIWMQEGASESLPGAVRVRHILYSPNGDPSTASTVAEDDPAWDDAKAKADAAYAKVKADIDQFDAIARAESDEDIARESGGKLPYFAVSDSIDPAFASAIFTGAPEAGELLEPVRSSFGWHVIQVMHYPTDMEWANKLKTEAEGGADFGDLARDNSDRAAAEDGGDAGWIGKGMLDPALEAALFATEVGGVSDPVKVDGDGVYLYKVVAEETREPDEEQKRTLESTAFSRWYSEQKALFQVTREAAAETAAGAAAG